MSAALQILQARTGVYGWHVTATSANDLRRIRKQRRRREA